jgi:flagellar hook-associated protein 3 FlgL
MRLSSANLYNASIDNLQRRQSDLVDLQMRMTSGKRVTMASDDPVAAARAERAMVSEMRSVTSQRSVEASRVIISQTETAFADATELLQQAREAIVAGGNATYTDSERALLAGKLKNIREELFAVANRTDGAGSYLFGGQGSSQPPFVDTPAPTGVQFRGVSGQMGTDAGTALPLSTDGSATWLTSNSGNGVFLTQAAGNSVTGQAVAGAWISAGSVIDPSSLFPTADTGYRIRFTSATDYTIESYPLATPNTVTTQSTGTYQEGSAINLFGMSVAIKGTPANGDRFEMTPSTPTLSVFGAVDTAIAELNTTNRTGAQRAQSTADRLRDIDGVMGTIAAGRAAAGDTLNRIDNETTRLSSQKLNAQTDRSNAEDLDMVDALSKFQNQQTGYDAALKSYSMVQRMSLFQYLNV